MKVLVIGHPEAVLGFSLVGVHGYSATSAAEVNLALDNALSATNIGIVLVTEDAAALVETRMTYLKLHSTIPLIVVIPAPGENRPDQLSLNEMVCRAIGVRI